MGKFINGGDIKKCIIVKNFLQYFFGSNSQRSYIYSQLLGNIGQHGWNFITIGYFAKGK